MPIVNQEPDKHRGGAWIWLVLVALWLPTSSVASDKPGLAILYFNYTGKSAELGVLKKGLAAMLIDGVVPVSKQVKVVERDRLESVLNELDLASSGKINPAEAAQVGKLTGARYMVLGSFFDLFGTLRIDARLVHVETGEIIGTVGKEGPMNDFFALRSAVVDGLNAAIAGVDFKARAIEKSSKIAPKTRNQTAPAVRSAPVPTKRVTTATIVTYSKALDAKDRGDTKTARELAQTVEREQPGAADLLGDLTSLMQ